VGALGLEAPPGFEPGMEVLQGHPRFQCFECSSGASAFKAERTSACASNAAVYFGSNAIARSNQASASRYRRSALNTSPRLK
jgi:hypothetical protein